MREPQNRFSEVYGKFQSGLSIAFLVFLAMPFFKIYHPLRYPAMTVALILFILSILLKPIIARMAKQVPKYESDSKKEKD